MLNDFVRKTLQDAILALSQIQQEVTNEKV